MFLRVSTADASMLSPSCKTGQFPEQMSEVASTGRKNRSVTCKKSQAQTCAAWLREIGRPRLTSWLLCANPSHVLLNGSLADTKAKLQEFSANPLSTPKPILSGHLSDQGDGSLGNFWLTSKSLGLTLPIHAKELPMEAAVRYLVAQ